MPRSNDCGPFDLAEVFSRAQQEMLAHFDLSRLLAHPSTTGTASERQWLELFDRFLPQRYRARPAFVIDSLGNRSRQIDLAIFDNFQTAPLFPHSAGLHVPAECVYAVFEVKASFSKRHVEDASAKALSVRKLHRSETGAGPRPILGGLLATGAVWSAEFFSANLQAALADCAGDGRLDLGCALRQGSFETLEKTLRISASEESLAFFVIRLIERLRALGPAPPVDLMQYGQFLRSFKK